MAGPVSGEVEVNVPASKAWKLYNSLDLIKITKKGLDHIVDKIEAEGDGSVGTTLHFTFHPGTTLTYLDLRICLVVRLKIIVWSDKVLLWKSDNCLIFFLIFAY